MVLQPQELNYSNNSNKQGTDSPLKTAKETQLNDGLDFILGRPILVYIIVLPEL